MNRRDELNLKRMLQPSDDRSEVFLAALDMALDRMVEQAERHLDEMVDIGNRRQIWRSIKFKVGAFKTHYRTYDEQAELYARWLEKHPREYAYPGEHEGHKLRGVAIDLAVD